MWIIEFCKKTTNKPRTVYDVIDGKPVKVLITQNRYLCSSCHKTFAITFYLSRKKFTSDFEDFIAQTMVNENLTYTDIRNRYGISKGALSKILNSYIDRFNERSFKFESCKYLYFHKFVYNKKDCCCICGSNLNDTIDLKLLGIYREYSPEIIEEFYHRISTLDNIKIIFHNYDAFVTEALSQKFRATVAIKPKDFLSFFWEIANKDYYPENDSKNNNFKETMKDFYNAISKELVSPRACLKNKNCTNLKKIV